MVFLRGFTITALLACFSLAGACSRGSDNLFNFEVDYLAEDVVDLMTVTFQAGENAYAGDGALATDILEEAEASNSFTVTYELPFGDRIGLGAGFGTAELRVVEDSVVNEDPFGFSPFDTSALTVEISYRLRYEGETQFGRATDLDLLVSAVATRPTAGDPFEVEYFIEGSCFFGATLCDFQTRFIAFGRPRDGILAEFGDAEGIVDDPDVYDIYYLDLDFFADGFRAQGDVGCCAFFEEVFSYEEVL